MALSKPETLWQYISVAVSIPFQLIARAFAVCRRLVTSTLGWHAQPADRSVIPPVSASEAGVRADATLSAQNLAAHTIATAAQFSTEADLTGRPRSGTICELK